MKLKMWCPAIQKSWKWAWSGVPDEQSSELVRCYIVKKDESLTAEEIMIYCKDKLTAYKRPKKRDIQE